VTPRVPRPSSRPRLSAQNVCYGMGLLRAAEASEEYRTAALAHLTRSTGRSRYVARPWRGARESGKQLSLSMLMGWPAYTCHRPCAVVCWSGIRGEKARSTGGCYPGPGGLIRGIRARRSARSPALPGSGHLG